MSVPVRTATPADRRAVIALLDSAILSFDREAISERIADDAVYVDDTPDMIRGALVRNDRLITALAVRHWARGDGIGTALVEAALADVPALHATCESALEPFYASLGFRLYRLPDGRLIGRRSGCGS